MAWGCNGSSVAPLTDYINNPIYQELIDEDDYFETRSDERIYLDFRASSGYTTEAEKLERNDSKINLYLLLKAATSKKLRVRVWVHSMGEYLYTRGKQSVKKGIWYLGGKKTKTKTRIKNRQQGKGFPIGLLAFAAVPLLGETAKSIFKLIFGKGRRRQ